MIYIATHKDLDKLATMLYYLYQEMMSEHYTSDMHIYRLEIMKHLNDSRDTIYIAEGGFFIIRDETEPMAPTLHRYNGIRVYIEPQHRHTRLLANFYKRLFEDFPNGDILGSTEINSEHIQVLDKRHECIAKVYKLKRG